MASAVSVFDLPLPSPVLEPDGSGFDLDLSRALRPFLSEVMALGVIRASVALVDPLRQGLVIVAEVDANGPCLSLDDRRAHLKFRVGEGIAGQVAQTGVSYHATVALCDPHFAFPTSRSSGRWPLLAIPINSPAFADPRVVAVLSVEGPDDGLDFFGDAMTDRLRALAAETLHPLEAASRSALVQSTVSFYRLRHILAVSQALVSRQTLAQILEQIARIAFDELEADLLTLYQWDPERLSFITPPIMLGRFFVPEAMGTQIHRGDLVDKVFSEWGSQFFHDASHDPRLFSLGRVPPRDSQPGRDRFPVREKISSAAALRLSVGPKHMGVLCVNWRKPHAFDEAERTVLEIFANHVAIAIENARLMRLAVAEAAAAQRERLHRDLHDEMGGKLLAIKHLAAACANDMAQDRRSEAGRSLAGIERMATDSLKLMRSLLLDLEALSGIDLRRALREFCDEQNHMRRAVVRLSAAGPLEKLRVDIPEGIFRIAREAVVNAQKHSQANVIEVRLGVSATCLSLEVIDDGVGGTLTPLEDRRHAQKYGVALMEQVAFALGARIVVGSCADASGWRVFVTLDSPLRC